MVRASVRRWPVAWDDAAVTAELSGEERETQSAATLIVAGVGVALSPWTIFLHYASRSSKSCSHRGASRTIATQYANRSSEHALKGSAVETEGQASTPSAQPLSVRALPNNYEALHPDSTLALHANHERAAG